MLRHGENNFIITDFPLIERFETIWKRKAEASNGFTASSTFLLCWRASNDS
jgi:hypothetical protein